MLLAVFLFAGAMPLIVLADENPVIQIVFETDLYKEGDTLSAKVYVKGDDPFDFAGYSIKYDVSDFVLTGCNEADEFSVSRSKADDLKGTVARSLYLKPGREVTAEDGRILIDTLEFEMKADGIVEAEFSVMENDAEFGKKSTILILGGSYYSAEGEVLFETTYAEILIKAKADAKAEVINYKNADDYRTAEKAILTEEILKADKAIDEAATIEDVEKAVTEAKAALDALKTDSQLNAEEESARAEALLKVKTQAKAEINGYKNPEDYRASERELLADEIAKVNEAIDEAQTAEAVEKAVAEAKEKLDAIKTDAQIKAEETCTHKEETVQGRAATCTETGLTEGRKCSLCKTVTVEQKVIEALGHKEEIIPGKAAEKTETGLTEGKKCSVCGEILVKQEVIPIPEKEVLIIGDVDGDGDVTAGDATQILRYINGRSSLFTAEGADETLLIKIADVDGDVEVTAKDATQILRYINGKTSVFEQM